MILIQMLLAALGCVYVAAAAWLIRGIRRQPQARTSAAPPVSVIVAARNESHSIANCLRALKDQEYGGSCEVVVVDDRSTDSTAAMVAGARRDWGELRLVQIAEGEGEFACPKKSALARGIAASAGEILLFTDADCEPPPSWVAATVERFGEGVGLVAGYARPRPSRRFRHRLLALDNLAVSAMAAGSIGMGTVLACTGRNLAYRRRVYDEVEGFRAIGHLIAGDDVYFAREVARRTNWRIAYNRRPEAVVTCDAGPSSWGALLHQKLRHAAKAGHYGGAARMLGVAIYAFHVALLWGLAQTVLSQSVPPAFAAAWLARWAVDFILVQTFSADPVDRRLIAFLPALEFVYIPYVLLFVPIGALGWFRWRDEENGDRSQSVSLEGY